MENGRFSKYSLCEKLISFSLSSSFTLIEVYVCDENAGV